MASGIIPSSHKLSLLLVMLFKWKPLATMAVEVLVNQYTDVRRHVPILVYENNGYMSIYEDRESVQLRNKHCFICNI
jgi:hypothetical protein